MKKLILFFAIIICTFITMSASAQTGKTSKTLSAILQEKLGVEVNESVTLDVQSSEKVITELNAMIGRFAHHGAGKVLFHLEKITSIQSVAINNPGADLNIITTGMVGGVETKVGIEFDFQNTENQMESTFWFTDAGLKESMLFTFKEDKKIDDYEELHLEREDGTLIVTCLVPVDDDYYLLSELLNMIDVMASK